MGTATMMTLGAAALAVGLASCAGRANGAAAEGEGDWHLRGAIAAVEPGPSATRVTMDAESGTGGPRRAVLLISSGTEIAVQLPDGTTRPGAVADLSPGARILARHTGVEMRSLPPQYHATHVRIDGIGR